MVQSMCHFYVHETLHKWFSCVSWYTGKGSPYIFVMPNPFILDNKIYSSKPTEKCLVERVCIIMPTPALLEFQSGSTKAALMKASEPETSLSEDWILYSSRLHAPLLLAYPYLYSIQFRIPALRKAPHVQRKHGPRWLTTINTHKHDKSASHIPSSPCLLHV